MKSRVLLAAVAALLAVGRVDAKPRTLLGHELKEAARWARKLEAPRGLLERVEEVAREAEPRRRELLVAALGHLKALDGAWGMVWNDEEILAREAPRARAALAALLRHERDRIRGAWRVLTPAEQVGLAARLEPHVRKPLRLPRKKRDQRALAGALQAAASAYRAVDPVTYRSLERAVADLRDSLAPLRAEWGRLAAEIRAAGDGASAWETRRRVVALEDLAARVDAELGRVAGEVLDGMSPTRRAGFLVALLRNTRRVGWVVARFHEVEELGLLD